MNYAQALEYLSSLNKFGMNFGLERINRLTEVMRHPEGRFKTIHIAGSNGKGSTAAMLASILNSAGLRTGLYTSPHLSDYTERIIVNNKQISREEMAAAISYTADFIELILKEGFEHPTEFEILTAAAFYYFAASGVEYAVIETGLGGLLDSTNVIRPKIAVITNVTLEHTDRCGGTVSEIAKHKAGIIKENIPVVTAAKEKALEVIARSAKEKNSELLVYQKDFTSEFCDMTNKMSGTQKINVTTRNMGALEVELNLLGLHQLENCAMAVVAALKLSQEEKCITHEAIIRGLKNVNWPGRFEIAGSRPLVVIDGAHNPDSARVLRANLDHYFPGKKITFIFGMLKDKDIRESIQNLIRPVDTVVAIQPNYYRAASVEDISREISNFAGFVETSSSIEAAIEKAKKIAGSEGIVCITGSLYLLGEARTVVYKNTI